MYPIIRKYSIVFLSVGYWVTSEMFWYEKLVAQAEESMHDVHPKGQLLIARSIV